MTPIDKLYDPEDYGRNFDYTVDSNRTIEGRVSIESFRGVLKTIVYQDRERPKDSRHTAHPCITPDQIHDDALIKYIITNGIETFER